MAASIEITIPNIFFIVIIIPFTFPTQRTTSSEEQVYPFVCFLQQTKLGQGKVVVRSKTRGDEQANGATSYPRTVKMHSFALQGGRPFPIPLFYKDEIG
ncbi:hypothetical protein BrL25_03955 [Brevibacillus laterosporus DSM 25]|nr:hypothetical protein BrL25_03955 [Brevibacillus laterosporus DSM 25]